MPILTESETLEDLGLLIRVPNLPDFNAGDPAFRINDIGGWDDAAKPDAVLVANGGGPGAVAAGAWQDAEAYYTLKGRFYGADRAAADTLRSLLLSGLPANAESSVQVLGGVADKQIFVRRYDVPTITRTGPHGRRFVVPLVAPDPYKYGLATLTATAGGFVSPDAFRTYSDGGGFGYRSYSDGGGFGYRNYVAGELVTSLPTVASLFSEGDVESRRVTTDVTGPLTAGSWWVEDAAGQRMWANVSLLAGQTITFDSRLRSASLAGQNIDHLVFTSGPGGGDFMTLRPGENTYRLIADSASGSFMTIEALEAYR